MKIKSLFAVVALLGSVLSVLPVSADPVVCAPTAFPPKPVPGGIIGSTWDSAKTAYDTSPAAGACVPDPTSLAPVILGLPDMACGTAAGETCDALVVSVEAALLGTPDLLCGTATQKTCFEVVALAEATVLGAPDVACQAGFNTTCSGELARVPGVPDHVCILLAGEGCTALADSLCVFAAQQDCAHLEDNVKGTATGLPALACQTVAQMTCPGLVSAIKGTPDGTCQALFLATCAQVLTTCFPLEGGNTVCSDVSHDGVCLDANVGIDESIVCETYVGGGNVNTPLSADHVYYCTGTWPDQDCHTIR